MHYQKDILYIIFCYKHFPRICEENMKVYLVFLRSRLGLGDKMILIIFLIRSSTITMINLWDLFSIVTFESVSLNLQKKTLHEQPIVQQRNKRMWFTHVSGPSRSQQLNDHLSGVAYSEENEWLTERNSHPDGCSSRPKMAVGGGYHLFGRLASSWPNTDIAWLSMWGRRSNNAGPKSLWLAC